MLRRDDKSTAELIRAALEKGFPNLCNEARIQLATELVRITRRSIELDYDLREATLIAKGAKKSTLGNKLQELRKTAGYTQEEVSKKFEWHPAKVTRIESGRVPVAIMDLRYLLDLYGVRDDRTRDELAAMARADREEKRSHRASHRNAA